MAPYALGIASRHFTLVLQICQAHQLHLARHWPCHPTSTSGLPWSLLLRRPPPWTFCKSSREVLSSHMSDLRASQGGKQLEMPEVGQAGKGKGSQSPYDLGSNEWTLWGDWWGVGNPFLWVRGTFYSFCLSDLPLALCTAFTSTQTPSYSIQVQPWSEFSTENDCL